MPAPISFGMNARTVRMYESGRLRLRIVDMPFNSSRIDNDCQHLLRLEREILRTEFGGIALLQLWHLREENSFSPSAGPTLAVQVK